MQAAISVVCMDTKNRGEPAAPCPAPPAAPPEPAPNRRRATGQHAPEVPPYRPLFRGFLGSGN